MKRNRINRSKQQLDMSEEGAIRGGDVEQAHGHLEESASPNEGHDPLAVDELIARHHRGDISEPDREGDDLSGDEHSAGLQGDESELQSQAHLDSDVPGSQIESEPGFHVIREGEEEGGGEEAA